MSTLLDRVSFAQTFEGKTERIIIELLYSTGMRRIELCHLKESQIEFGTKLIRIIGKGNKERLMPMVPNLANLLQDYLIEI